MVAARQEVTGDIVLEFPRSLADVVQLSRKAQDLSPSQGGCEPGRKRADGRSVICRSRLMPAL